MSKPLPGNQFFEAFLSGGDMGRRIREYDWAATSLGAVDSWSPGLQSALSICLHSNFPIAIYWGTELVLLYNDAWSPIPGKKHPWALGKPAIEVWPEIWADIEPQFEKAFSGTPGGSGDALLPMQRNGYTEECYFDFTFTPILGSSGQVEGVFNAVIETTHRVIHHRRTTFLQKLADQLRTVYQQETLFEKTVKLVGDNPYDLPFCIFYSLPENRVLAGTHNVGLIKDLPLGHMLRTGEPVLINDISEYLEETPDGPWPERPKEAFMMPLRWQDGKIFGYLLVGISARRWFDTEYQSFFESVAGTLIAVSNTIRSLEHERQKAEALAEIDRAKTTFFSNISHEFRTPLTLMLGPVEEVLDDTSLSDENKSRLELVQRNARRLQKLVNNLLDFSRLEAGRMKAAFVKTDIGAFTTDLASNFRSAMEKAGIAYIVKTDSIKGDVYVDRELWEKIIFNLLSNAFKYTKAGQVSVYIYELDHRVLVEISDTGSGIAEHELERIFERFHRIANDSGRSQEGTGIGLAMVKELVRLHGGDIFVESEPGKGSVFTISLPTGHTHLQSGSIVDASAPWSSHTTDVTDELVGWTGGSSVEASSSNGQPKSDEHLFTENIIRSDDISDHQLQLQFTRNKKTILLAEDNSDMRTYLTRLLSHQFNVITTSDGETAFRLVLAHKPELIISDIMMPVLDGFGLLEKLRNHIDTRNIPLIFLSARAGEEARVEGLNAGADDYLVKPFSSHELLARVTGLIRIQDIRRKTEQQFYDLFMQAPAIINVFKGPEFRYELYHPKNRAIFGDHDFTGLTLQEAHPELETQGIIELLNQVYLEGKSISLMERGVLFKTADGSLEEHFFNLIYQPWFDDSGNIQGVLNFAIEVTDMVKARRKIEESEIYFRRLIDTVPTMIWISNPDGESEYFNKSWYAATGQTENEAKGLSWINAIHPDDRENTARAYYSAAEKKTSFASLYRLRQKDGLYRWSIDQGHPRYDIDGDFEGYIGSVVDVHEEKLSRDRLQESEEQFRNLAEMLPQLVWITDNAGNLIYACRRWSEFTGIEPDPAHWHQMVHADDLPVITRIWERSLREGNVYRTQMRIKRKDGEYFWFYVQGVPVQKEDGSVSRWIGSCTNIQEQKLIEKELESLVAERTEQLQRSNNDLQQFAHVASHDLKEPLRKIRTFAGRLAEDNGCMFSEKGLQYLGKLNAATDRMMMMIEGVLNYSLLDGDEQLPGNVDLAALITEAEQDLELMMQQKNATITCVDLPVIEGARVLLYQLFYNLINNSLKFSDAGVTAPNIVIRGNVFPQQNSVMITVQDNGIGFDPEFGEKIFDAFTRLNSRDRYEGTGLGLSLCKRIVERHHGSISATGEKGKGACFTISLPLKQSGEPI